MPIVLNDGGVPFGTTQITIGSETYYIENSAGTTPTNITDVPDEVGSPRKQVMTSGKKSGTMTLQLETSSSLIPTVGQLFTVPAGYGGIGSAVSASVSEVGTPRANNDYAKVDISWVAKLT